MMMDARGILVSLKAADGCGDALQAPFTYQTLDSAPLDSPYWEILAAVTAYEIALTLLADPRSSTDANPERRAALLKSMDQSLDRLGQLLAQARPLR
jgi:hypothetical protein